jgi:trans-2,3-dihydro-3-hydroxyanthranilate isomerase
LALGVWLAATDLVPADAETAYTVDQGAEMGRPSKLACTVHCAVGRATATTVTGQVAPVARGDVAVPATGEAADKRGQ